MRTTSRLVAVAAVAAVWAIGSAAPASADPRFGIRGGIYTDPTDAFAGAELLFPISHSVYVNPNLEYVFRENATFMTFNGDFHYDFPTHHGPYVWLGAGLAVVYRNPDGPADGDTDVGANFLAGIGARGHGVIPYLQAKLIVKDNTQFSVAAGLRF
jgi:hypothetical protein